MKNNHEAPWGLSRYYDVLGLKTGAPAHEVKQAYRRLVKEWHPDRFPHDVLLRHEAHRRLQEINAAYSRLQAVTAAAPPADRTLDTAWQKIYSIGIRHVDKQHEIFFKMLNSFNDKYVSTSMITPENEAKLNIYLSILNLRRYALNHFLTEEEYMAKFNYPSFYDHRKKHDDFIKKVFKMEEEYFNFNKLLPTKIIDFMASWLEDHIKEVDKEFGKYLNEVIGISPIL